MMFHKIFFLVLLMTFMKYNEGRSMFHSTPSRSRISMPAHRPPVHHSIRRGGSQITHSAPSPNHRPNRSGSMLTVSHRAPQTIPHTPIPPRITNTHVKLTPTHAPIPSTHQNIYNKHNPTLATQNIVTKTYTTTTARPHTQLRITSRHKPSPYSNTVIRREKIYPRHTRNYSTSGVVSHTIIIVGVLVFLIAILLIGKFLEGDSSY